MACRTAFVGVGVLSCVINLLYLTGSFFMLEVYDRVLPSRSVPTLIGLIVLAGGLYLAQGMLDVLRSRVLVRIGRTLDDVLSGRVFQLMVRLPLIAGRGGTSQPVRDLDSVRSFLSGAGPGAFFDLPWLPLYLVVCFAFHTLLGLTALVGAVLLVLLTVLTGVLTRESALETSSLSAERGKLGEASRRNAEVLAAMGMGRRLQFGWEQVNRRYLDSSQRISDIAGGIGAIAKVARMMVQSAVLGVGAYLVIQQEATAGVIIAGSILSARALAPVDLAVANWNGFATARQSWRRLEQLMTALPEAVAPTQLPRPSLRLSVEGVSVVAPGRDTLLVGDVSFALQMGNGLGIIGPSGSGKSSLLRALAGVWQPARGKVRLDSASLDQWSPDELGRFVGYLPQDVELFDGTIAQNIGRFDPDATSEDIIAAARQAGVHEMIVSMRDGYDSQVGDGGSVLSAGQAQRIGLARALYGDPFLIVLDEPNSNLDSDGDAALTQALRAARARGAIVVVVAHRPVGIEAVDLLLVLNGGRVQAFGPKDTVLAQATARPPAPAKVVPEARAVHA